MVENERKTFSLRLPVKTADQIDERRKLSRRTRNEEIVYMLEQHLDLLVARDMKILSDLSEGED